MLICGNTPTQIKDELDSVYGDSASSFTTVKVWVAEFKCGRKSLGRDERSGRPNTATTDENIAKVHQIVLDDYRIKPREELAEKRPHLQKKKILFHQDNAPSHTSAVAMAEIHELRFEMLDHPLYSPYLAPSDFFLFPHLKFALGRQGFSPNKEAITFENNYFAEKKAEYYLDGLQRRVTEMGASPREVCRVTRRLC
ncbi:histone-lysine N-methyltransferase SETMAR [Trichonephila clavipes]|uniref:Histone-lysine N-methyltransferase SETMAR n=1 Tax=Trichonephila clavipes TaxID=2585209 RepID=A0A8X7BLB5_TRICX|nr:histone-lysine N-methyltransferase SETMAR [Trichonephila clavipes]